MRYLLTAAVLLGGAFGSATATVESVDGDVMVVNMEVEVLASAQSVVAHLSFDNDQVLTFPMLDRGGGLFGLTTELETKNYLVVFEVLGSESPSSDPVSLTQMGAEYGQDSSGTTTTTEAEGISNENQQMLWLAIAAGAASLSLLAFWVLGPKQSKDETSVETDEEE